MYIRTYIQYLSVNQFDKHVNRKPYIQIYYVININIEYIRLY